MTIRKPKQSGEEEYNNYFVGQRKPATTITLIERCINDVGQTIICLLNLITDRLLNFKTFTGNK